MKTYEGKLTVNQIKSNDIIVFGSNANGFHGAGAAAFAMYGKSGNLWKTENIPGTNKKLHELPDGTKGYFTVKGISKGYSEGLFGRSYAIQTVMNPGQRRSVYKEDIISQIYTLYEFAKAYPNYNFLILTTIDRTASGYESYEIGEMYKSFDIPDNIVFNGDFQRLFIIGSRETTEISSFKGELLFCSNFWRHPIIDRGMQYQTTEHLYQSMKFPFNNKLVRYSVKNAKTPAFAKETARNNKSMIRSDWNNIKLSVMRYCSLLKFQDVNLSKLLKDTGDIKLTEGNTWHDNYWGHCTCPSCINKTKENNLGKILMTIRNMQDVNVSQDWINYINEIDPII